MPYELTFTKLVPITDPDLYFNECCIGGDVVLERLLPIIRARYSDIETNQEDWGWFVWFESEGTKLAVDIFCDNPGKGDFRVHLTSSVQSLMFWLKVVDTAELEHLRALAVDALSSWIGVSPKVERLSSKYLPI